MGLMDTVDAVKTSFLGDIPFVNMVPAFASAAMHAGAAQDAHYRAGEGNPNNSEEEQARYAAWGQKSEHENDLALTSLVDAVPGVSIGRKLLGVDEADVAGTWDWATKSVDAWTGGDPNTETRQESVNYHKMLKRAVGLNAGEGFYPPE